MYLKHLSSTQNLPNMFLAFYPYKTFLWPFAILLPLWFVTFVTNWSVWRIKHTVTGISTTGLFLRKIIDQTTHILPSHVIISRKILSNRTSWRIRVHPALRCKNGDSHKNCPGCFWIDSALSYGGGQGWVRLRLALMVWASVYWGLNETRTQNYVLPKIQFRFNAFLSWDDSNTATNIL